MRGSHATSQADTPHPEPGPSSIHAQDKDSAAETTVSFSRPEGSIMEHRVNKIQPHLAKQVYEDQRNEVTEPTPSEASSMVVHNGYRRTLPAQVLETRTNQESGNQMDETNARPPAGASSRGVIDGQPDRFVDQTVQYQVNKPEALPRPRQALTIGYWVVQLRNGRPLKIRWPDCLLLNKSLDTLFSEVSQLASKKDIRSIQFKLFLSQSDTRCCLAKHQNNDYEDMKGDFSEEMRKDARTTEKRVFDVWMELVPADAAAAVDEIEVVKVEPKEDDFIVQM